MKAKNKLSLAFNVISVGLIIAYLIIAGTRAIYVTTDELIDSTLQVNQAISITSGHWLGNYSPYLLTKGLSFPFFLVFNHLIGLPFNWALAIFNLGTVIILILVIIPFVNKKSLVVTTLLACLLFNPLMFELSTARTYRDATAYASMILLLAWVVGFVFNSNVAFRKSSFVTSVIAGAIGFPYWVNLREDSAWIYPFIVVAFGVSIVTALLKKVASRKWLMRISLLIFLPLFILGVEDLCIAGMNRHYYGRFVVNEYTSKDFKTAIGTMSAVKTNSWVINVPVNTAARKQMYKYVPAFKKLKPYLDENRKDGMDFFKDIGVAEPSLGHDYQGGWFPWAYRGAVAKAGYAHNSAQFKRYNERLVKQLLKAEKEGKISGSGKARSSLVAPIKVTIVMPTLRASKIVAHKMINFEGLTFNLQSSKEKSSKNFYSIVDFLKLKGHFSEGKNDLILSERVLIWLTSVAKLLSKLMIVVVMFSYLVYIIWRIKIHEPKLIVSDWWMLASLGMMISVVLRICMLGYVTATSFVAYSTSYMSSMYPLFTIGAFCCLFADTKVIKSLKVDYESDDPIAQ